MNENLETFLSVFIRFRIQCINLQILLSRRCLDFFAIFFANILSYFRSSAFKGICNGANSTKAQLRGAIWYRSAFLCMNNKFPFFSGKTPV